MGRLGSLLVVGVMLGLVLHELQLTSGASRFTGTSLLAGGVLGAMVLPPGVACWLAGRKMRRERDDPSQLSPALTWVASLLALLIGTLLAWQLGLPAS